MFTIFAAFTTRTYILPFNRSGYYYGCSDAALSKDIRLSIHDGLLLLRCSLFLSERGKVAFLILKNFNFSLHDKNNGKLQQRE